MFGSTTRMGTTVGCGTPESVVSEQKQHLKGKQAPRNGWTPLVRETMQRNHLKSFTAQHTAYLQHLNRSQLRWHLYLHLQHRHPNDSAYLEQRSS